MPTSVQVHFELFELAPEVSFTLLLTATAQKGRIDRKVDLQVEFELLADQVLLAKHDWNMAVPKYEEVLALPFVKGISHLLDATRGVLAKRALQLAAHVHSDFLVEHRRRLLVSLLL